MPIPNSTMDTHDSKSDSIADYLGAENLNYVSRLDIQPLYRALGNMVGEHKSPLTGGGVEFALHRSYVQGDDIRRLDWKIYGKSERLFIKRFEETTELKGVVCLDASSSMSYVGDPGRGPSKFEYAAKLAAAVCYLFLKQKDRVALVLFGSKVHTILPPSASPLQIARALTILRSVELEATVPGREDPPMAQVLHDLATRFDRKEMFVVISDLMENPADLSGFLGHLKHGQHEGLLMHVLDPMELSFPFRNWVRFESTESSDRHLLECGGFRKAYQEALADYLDQIRKACLMYGIHHSVCKTSLSWRQDLTDALTMRRRSSPERVRGV